MSASRRLGHSLLACLLLASPLGCGDARPQTYPAAGTVRYPNGSPVRTGFVELIPVNGGPSARGVLNRRGQFTLGTFESTDGAIAGEFVALVLQQVRPLSSEAARELGAEHQEHAGATRVVSLKYSSSQTSDLACTVNETGENYFELTVEPR